MSHSDIFLCGHSHDAMCWPLDCSLLLKWAGELNYILPVRKATFEKVKKYIIGLWVGPILMLEKSVKRVPFLVQEDTTVTKTWISEDITLLSTAAFYFRGKPFPVLTHVLFNVTAALLLCLCWECLGHFFFWRTMTSSKSLIIILPLCNCGNI